MNLIHIGYPITIALCQTKLNGSNSGHWVNGRLLKFDYAELKKNGKGTFRINKEMSLFIHRILSHLVTVGKISKRNNQE